MKKKAVILGGGITGLRIASYLQENNFEVTILEKTPKIGGMTSSFIYKDFILDYGPHKFYTQLPGVYDDFKKIIGEVNYLTVKKENSIRLLGNYFDFPVKLSQLFTMINPILTIKIGLDLIKEKMNRKEAKNYEEYFIKGFGKTGYKIVFEGFASKVWGNPKNLSVELARRRSPAKNIFEVLKTALIKGNDVSADYFLYPKLGYGVICENLSKEMTKNGGKIILNAKALNLNLKEKKVSSVDLLINNRTKKQLPCDVLISTMAINELILLIKEKKLSQEIKDALENIKFRSLIIAYIFLKKNKALKDNWIFFPEKEFCFNRVAEQKSFSKYTCPKDKTVLTAEITCNFNDETYLAPENEIKDKVINDLVKAKLIKREEVYDFIIRKAGRVYPVYDLDYKKNLNILLNFLDEIPNIYTVGRLGLFNYNNADHCLDMAKVTTQIIINNKNREEWKKARNYFDSYRIVD